VFLDKYTRNYLYIFYAVEVFWAKNIHITDLELDNISNIKMQRNNKLKPSRKK